MWKYIEFGFAMFGEGTAWFDDIQIQIDGKDYMPDSGFIHSLHNFETPPKISLTSKQLQWLYKTVSPLKTTDPNASLSDLAPLKEIIGNAYIVGLGEAAHGTHEFFQLKHRIIKFLSQNVGFTIFAIEANMPEAYRLNDYVLHGTGDSFGTYERNVLLDVEHRGNAWNGKVDA